MTILAGALRRTSRFLAIAGASLVLFAGTVGSVPAIAEEAQSEASKAKTRRVPTLSEAVYKKLAEAQEAIDAKDFNTAENVINKALERRKNLNGNEVAQLQNMLGFIFFSKEDYPRAINSYKDVVAQGDKIPEGLETTTLYTLAQLSFVTERYQDALRYMETWITKANNPGADPHIFMGQVYYQMKNYPAAITQIEKGIRIAKERNIIPKEQWWALLNFLYYEKEDWPKVLETLEVLVKQFPKRDYWVRLAGIHGQEGNENEQLWAMEAAYTAGFLNRQTDLTNLSGLLMQAEVPYRAAKVLDKGMKDGVIEKDSKTLRSLGQAWQMSQETAKAIPVFESAAKIADDGKIYDRLANLHLDDDNYPACITAADSALRKGGLRKSQVTHLVKGMCLYNQDKLNTARKSFSSCRNKARQAEDETNQRICGQWISFVDNELNRREQLAKAL